MELEEMKLGWENRVWRVVLQIHGQDQRTGLCCLVANSVVKQNPLFFILRDMKKRSWHPSSNQGCVSSPATPKGWFLRSTQEIRWEDSFSRHVQTAIWPILFFHSTYLLAESKGSYHFCLWDPLWYNPLRGSVFVCPHTHSMRSFNATENLIFLLEEPTSCSSLKNPHQFFLDRRLSLFIPKNITVGEKERKTKTPQIFTVKTKCWSLTKQSI